MSNGTSSFERFSKLVFQIGRLVMEGKRNAEEVSDVLQTVLEKKDFKNVLLVGPTPPFEVGKDVDWPTEWRSFYKEVLGMDVQFQGVEIPRWQWGYGWVILVPQGLDMRRVGGGESGINLCYWFENPVVKHDREPVKSYAIRVRDRIEADEEYEGLTFR